MLECVVRLVPSISFVVENLIEYLLVTVPMIAISLAQDVGASGILQPSILLVCLFC